VGAHLAGLQGHPTFTQEQLKQAHCHTDQPTCEDGRHALPPRRHRCYEYETQGSSYYSRPRTGSSSDNAGN
jgi:hypothetical protein